MKLKTAYIRGSKGVKKGMGVDSISINFDEFEPGLIGLMGPIGSGKTTIAELLTPYLFVYSHPRRKTLPSGKRGELGKAFFLKDSERTLTFELDGHLFISQVLINGENGKLKAFLKKDGIELNEDGNQDSYCDALDKNFCSPELFYRSNFMAQKRKDFSQVDPSERKNLLLAMMGANALEAKAKYSADQAKADQKQIDELTGRIGQLESTIAGLHDIDDSIKIGEDIVSSREISIAAIESRITVLNAELTGLDEKAKAQVAIKTELSSLESAITNLKVSKTSVSAEYGKKLQSLETSIGIAKADVDTQEKLLDPAKLERMRELVAKRAELAAEIERHVEAHEKHVAAKTELSTAKSEAALVVAKLGPQVEQAELFVGSAKQSAQLIEEVPCQKLADEEERKRCSSCKFLLGAVTARDRLPQYESELAAARDARAKGTNLAEAKIQSAADYLAENPFDEARAKACKAELAAIDAQKPAEYIQRAELAESKLTASREKLTSLQAQHSTVSTEQTAKVSEIESKIQETVTLRDAKAEQIDRLIDGLIASTKQQITDTNKELQADRDQLTAAKKDIEALKVQLDQRADAQFMISSCKAELAVLESDQADWAHLDIGLGKNGGFAAILVESVGDEVSVFANELLSLFGKNWTIQITTVKETADGTGEREGFFVWVTLDDGEVMELADLSGGQELIVDAILHHAFSYYMASNSGVALRTKFMDEADGSLDLESAIQYHRAVEMAHQRSNLIHTLIITHRPELQQAISQRIRCVPGKGIEIERD